MENLNSMQPIMSYDPANFFLFHERKQPFSHFDANFTESFKSHRLVGFFREKLYTVMNLYSEHDGLEKN